MTKLKLPELDMRNVDRVYISNERVYENTYQYSISVYASIDFADDADEQQLYDEVLEWCCDNHNGNWAYEYIDEKSEVRPNRNGDNISDLSTDEKLNFLSVGVWMRYLTIHFQDIDDVTRFKLRWQ